MPREIGKTRTAGLLGSDLKRMEVKVSPVIIKKKKHVTLTALTLMRRPIFVVLY
jgi:hypothetical protein